MMKYLSLILSGVLLLFAQGLATCQVVTHNQVKMTFQRSGLTTLSFLGTELLQDGDFQVKSAQMAHWDNTSFYDADLTQGLRTVDLKTQTTCWTYPWGSASCQYTVQDNQLDLLVEVVNNTKEPLHSIVLQPLALHFPSVITFDGERRKGANVESPTVIGMKYDKGVVVLVNEEVGRPLYAGVADGINDKTVGTPYPILIGSEKNAAFPTAWLEDPVINRTIYPGEKTSFRLSLRFGATGNTVEQLADDIYQRFADTFPMTLQWTDHRPLGMLALSSAERTSASNPRGWFMDTTLDVSTVQGKEQIRKRLMDYADGSVKELKRVGAQGMITWDIEGQQYPHATSYLGDPRSLPAEMEPIADAYFKRFTDAGLRVGLCLRPQRPVRYVYKEDKVEQELVADIAFYLIQKIKYANTRWGCTMFYIDSNATHDPFKSASDPAAYELMSSAIFQQVAAAFPNLLLIPEQKDVRYHAFSIPIRELRQGFPETPAHVRRTYPKACSVIVVNDAAMDTNHAALLDGVKHGDILMFRAWFQDLAYSDKVISLYKEAAQK